MKRFNSLKKNQDFQTVYRGGKSYANKYLVMYVMDSGREDTRIGISASKKVGNSVVRHRFARLVRESFRLNKDILEEGKDIIVVARAAAKDKNFDKIDLIKIYRKFISPCIGPHCIYTPTCSQYAMEAIRKYGAIKGTYLACRRILRCHPFAKGGYDPVP